MELVKLITDSEKNGLDTQKESNIMKHLKLFEDFNRNIKGEEFFDWLSMKFGQTVGQYLGSGMAGMLYCFGKDCKRVIKLTRRYDMDYASIKDKNIKGVIKIYSNGKINVPEKYLTKELDDRAKYVDVKNGMIPVDKNNDVYYTIMEYIKTDQTLSHSIEDLTHLIEEFVSKNYTYEFDNYIGDEIPMLRVLFLECENIQFLQDLYDFAYEYYDKKVADSTVETMAELSVLFKNIKPYFDWNDIHAEQFGYNSKGEIVAYDIDNPAYLASDDVNTYIKESNSNKIYYHGTNEDFERFSQDKSMSNTGAKTSLLGFFFTDEKEVAESFGTKMKECELDFNNPFELGYVRYHNHGVDNHNSKDGFMALREGITKKANKENWSDVTNEDILDWKETLMNMGYDCLVINTQMDSNLFKSKYVDGRTYRYLDFHKMYIVFDPEQIKVIN
jgi:hypothetical protein